MIKKEPYFMKIQSLGKAAIVMAAAVMLLCVTGCGKKDSTEEMVSSESSVVSPAALDTVSTTAEETTTVPQTTTTAAAEECEFIKEPNYESDFYIVVYKGSQSTVVYGKDEAGKYTQTVKAFTCSSAKKSHKTPAKLYAIRAKYRWRDLVGNVWGQYCSSYSEYFLFHSVPYSRTKNPASLKNAEYDLLGQPASDGCIRMCVRDCKWIYDNCPIGTQVNIVEASGPEGQPVPPRNTDKKYKGWDPTDEWSEGNPYFDAATPEGTITDITKATTTAKKTTTKKKTTATKAATAATAAETTPSSDTQPTEAVETVE